MADNVDLLAGGIIVVSLLLLWCKYGDSVNVTMGDSKAEGMSIYAPSQGLRLSKPKKEGFYTNQKAGQFAREGMDAAPTAGLNGLETVPAPASNMECLKPVGYENDILWAPDAAISLNVYTRDGNVDNHNQIASSSEEELLEEVFKRNDNRVKTNGVDTKSLCGSILTLTDYGSTSQPRYVTY